MLHALLKNKLRVANSAVDYRDVEDHLTAAVLERVSYLSSALAANLIETSIVEQCPGRFNASKATASDDKLWVTFWPRFDDPTLSQSIVEPDAILGIGDHVYVVEAKRTDDDGQHAEQAARDWLSFYMHENENDGVGCEESGAGTLLLLGGVADARCFFDLAQKIERYILDLKGNDGEDESTPIPRIVWVSWAKLAGEVRASVQNATPQEARILGDIELALAHHGFGVWVTFARLCNAVETHVGTGPLPTVWPPMQGLVRCHDPQPTAPISNPIDQWYQIFSTTSIATTPDFFVNLPNGPEHGN